MSDVAKTKMRAAVEAYIDLYEFDLSRAVTSSEDERVAFLSFFRNSPSYKVWKQNLATSSADLLAKALQSSVPDFAKQLLAAKASSGGS
jgi:hypothetical protein